MSAKTFEGFPLNQEKLAKETVGLYLFFQHKTPPFRKRDCALGHETFPRLVTSCYHKKGQTASLDGNVYIPKNTKVEHGSCFFLKILTSFVFTRVITLQSAQLSGSVGRGRFPSLFTTTDFLFSHFRVPLWEISFPQYCSIGYSQMTSFEG